MMQGVGGALLAFLILASGLQAQGTSDRCAPSRSRSLTRAAVAGSGAAGNVALWVYFKNAWWSGERADHFFVRDDLGTAFLDQDKFGHFYGGYHLARIGSQLLRTACVSDRRAAWWGAGYAALFQLQIEVWDGFYEKYGFSPSDVAANTAGAGYALAQALSPPLRHVKPTFSYWPTRAYRSRGTTGADLRPTTDYAGQTYWLSADVDALLPRRVGRLWPGLLRLSAGHGITDWVDPQTGLLVPARRRILLTLDVDPEKLPGDQHFWRAVKRELSYVHFPAPALQLYPTVRGIGWYR